MGSLHELRLAPSSAFERALLPQVFRPDGEIWTIASAGKQVHLRDLRGLHYIATLLRDPGRRFHVSDLVRIANDGAHGTPVKDSSLTVVLGLGDAGARIDTKARSAYLARLRALARDQADGERRCDLACLGLVSAEREALLAELEGAARSRRSASHSERARTAVTKAIKAALQKIAANHPDLGAHFSATIRRGYLCAYLPDPRLPVAWET